MELLLLQIIRHELGHNLGMKDSPGLGDNHPTDWDCGLHGNIMGGNAREEWSPCSVMDFRRRYTDSVDNWCLEGKNDCFEYSQQNLGCTIFWPHLLTFVL